MHVPSSSCQLSIFHHHPLPAFFSVVPDVCNTKCSYQLTPSSSGVICNSKVVKGWETGLLMHTGIITTALGMQVWDFLGTTCKTGMTRWHFSWLKFDSLNIPVWYFFHDWNLMAWTYQSDNTVVRILPRARLLWSIRSAPRLQLWINLGVCPWQTAFMPWT